MNTYYVSGSNLFSFRTENTGSANLTLYVQDMYRLTNSTASIDNYDWDKEQQLLTFTASLSGASEGDEYRAYIKDDCGNQIWHGSIQVYASQSVNKPDYKTQLDDYKSNVTENEYIILED